MACPARSKQGRTPNAERRSSSNKVLHDGRNVAVLASMAARLQEHEGKDHLGTQNVRQSSMLRISMPRSFETNNVQASFTLGVSAPMNKIGLGTQKPIPSVSGDSS